MADTTAGTLPAAPAKPRKKRRVFLWIFLAVQVIFLIILVNYAASSTMPTHAEIMHACSNPNSGGWVGLYSSHAQCVAAKGGLIGTYQAAKGLAITMTVIAWCVVDFLLAVPYGIYRLCKR